MRGRRVRDATSKERHVCARRRDVSRPVPETTGGVTFSPAQPQVRRDALAPAGIR
jgi:hypothetical protein